MGNKEIKAPAPTCVILGAGDILNYEASAARIPKDALVICADGGLRHCAGLGVRPGLLVGDFDSADLSQASDGVDIVRLSPEKNYTDSFHAVEEAEARGHRSLLLCGMLGGRLDHTLANLQLLASCATRGLIAALTDGLTDVYPLAAPSGETACLTLEPRANHYFSLLSMVDACQGVTIQGAVYPLEDYPLSSLEARAVSNEFCGEPVRISLRGGVLVVVVTPK